MVRADMAVVEVTEQDAEDRTKLGRCPFNGPLSRMKYPTRTKSTTRRCVPY